MDLVVAHHPGWDVMLVLALPVAVYVGLRVWESRKGPPGPDDAADRALPDAAGGGESGRPQAGGADTE